MRCILGRSGGLALSMEGAVREKIEVSNEPMETALLYARIGNYIDFGAMNHVDEQTFLRLFENAKAGEPDTAVMKSLFRQCESAESFLLVADNCGEIVLDKLFLTELRRRFPKLDISVMVRGGEVLNDATMEDAEYVRLRVRVGTISPRKAASSVTPANRARLKLFSVGAASFAPLIKPWTRVKTRKTP